MTAVHRTFDDLSPTLPYDGSVAPAFSIHNWKLEPSLAWMRAYWHYTIYISILYAATIFTIKHCMKKRQSFELRTPLAVWNIALSAFSAVGFYYMFFEMYESFYLKGLNNSVCCSSNNSQAQYWMWLFALSKIFELGDTIFIVLRKQKLIFLHWFHHILTMIFTWYSYGQNISLGRWFVSMNLFVHIIMYAYYALRSLKFKVPQPFAMAITTLQIVQMIFGFYVSSHAFFAKLTGAKCDIPMKTATFGFAVYTSFFYLFARLFINSYLRKTNLSEEERRQAQKKLQ